MRNVLESEEYAACVSEFMDSPELRDGILMSLLEDNKAVNTSSPVPAGFAGFYELIGIVSHMVSEGVGSEV